jgi:hypothetical protein
MSHSVQLCCVQCIHFEADSYLPALHFAAVVSCPNLAPVVARAARALSSSSQYSIAFRIGQEVNLK